MHGLVTDIQRFSLHDGPGIRTTVFLKGCNLRCKWCHNPETLSSRPELLIYPEKCIGCGHCITVCETGARTMQEGGIVFDRSKCTACGKCADVCFSGSLMISGRYMTPESVLEEVSQDKEYYEKSGGGLTLSGGEVLLQKDFALELLKLAQENGISAAIETNMDYQWSDLEQLLPFLDLVMFDIKLMDEADHIKWTGGSNKMVLDNAKRLMELDIPIIIRTPVIPGVNDNPKAIAEISEYIKDAPNLMYYELLNFNPLGNGKYEALQMENTFAKSRPLGDEEIDELARAAKAPGTRVKVG